MKAIRSILLVTLLILALPVPVGAAEKALTMAIFPYLPVPEILRRYTPLAAYLERETGLPVSVRVAGNLDEHIKAIGNDNVDIALIGPVPYIHLVQQYGAKPKLARFESGGKSTLVGVIAVRKDSPHAALADLRDASIAFGDRQSTMTHVVPRYLLIKAGLPRGLPARHTFVGTHHRNVALGVLAGDFDAGAMKMEVFQEFAARGLRILATTPGVPDFLFIARSNLPAASVEKLREAMLRLKNQTGGVALLEQIQHGLTGFGPISENDFAELRVMVKAVDDASR